MKLRPLIACGMITLALAACGGPQDTAPASESRDAAPKDMADSAGMNRGNQEGRSGIGHATGTIQSIGSEGDFLTIDHGEFEGDIQMGAMTMGFDIMGNVDLSGFKEGDEVAFRVKQGRDGSYRVMAICNTATDGNDCLNETVDH